MGASWPGSGSHPWRERMAHWSRLQLSARWHLNTPSVQGRETHSLCVAVSDTHPWRLGCLRIKPATASLAPDAGSRSDALAQPGPHAHFASSQTVLVRLYTKHGSECSLGDGSLQARPDMCAWATRVPLPQPQCHPPLSVTFHSPWVTRQLQRPRVGLLEGGWGPDACGVSVLGTEDGSSALLGLPTNPAGPDIWHLWSPESVNGVPRSQSICLCVAL